MTFPRRRRHEDALAHLHGRKEHYRRLYEHERAKVANLRQVAGQYRTERDVAMGRVRDLAADLANLRAQQRAEAS